MYAWRLRYQYYTIRASSKEEAIAKAVKAIRNDPEGFVIDAEPPEPAPSTLVEVAKAVVTGKP
jgi:hypothetical protein